MITIIILLILAGVGISALVGKNGILQRAKDSISQEIIARIKEDLALAVQRGEVDYYNKNEGGIVAACEKAINEDVEGVSDVSSSENVITGIVTRKNTKYEFEVNVSTGIIKVDLYAQSQKSNIIFASKSNSDGSLKVTASVDEEYLQTIGGIGCNWKLVANGDEAYEQMNRSKKDYSFVQNGNKWTSNNVGINDTMAISAFEINISQNQSYTIKYGTSSEARYDKLYIMLDNNRIIEDISGNTEDEYTVNLESGSHTLYVWFEKDSSGASGEDVGFIILESTLDNEQWNNISNGLEAYEDVFGDYGSYYGYSSFESNGNTWYTNEHEYNSMAMWEINLNSDVEYSILYRIVGKDHTDGLYLYLDGNEIWGHEKYDENWNLTGWILYTNMLSSGNHKLIAKYENYNDCSAEIILENITDKTEMYEVKIGIEENNCNTSGSEGITINSSGIVYAELVGSVSGILDKNKVNIYSLNYDGNGGTGVMSSVLGLSGSDVTVIKNTFDRPSELFGFSGWNTKMDGSGDKYIGGETISLTNNMTMFAQWSDGLQVGSTVKYTPGKREYKFRVSDSCSEYESWRGDESLRNYTDYNSDSAYEVNAWRILSLDEETGTVELVPSEWTTKNGGYIELQGAQGYNNAVYLLNEACNKLFGDSSRGITARNINIEDIESKLNEDGKKAITSNTNSYGVKYGQQVERTYTNTGSYPLIYERELNSVINGKTYTSGLKQSEQNELIGGTDTSEILMESATLGAIRPDSIRPYKTSYSFTYSDFLEYLGENFNGVKYSDILLPYGEDTNYFIASRSIDPLGNLRYYGFVDFEIKNVNKGSLACSPLYANEDHINKYSLIFPVVKVDLSRIKGNAKDGFKVE